MSSRMLTFIVSSALAAASAAQAQVPSPTTSTTPAAQDARWQPWLGCWQADDDSESDRARTCITARPNGGVSMVTLVGTQRVSDETRIADDREHPLQVGNCRGTERARWASRGHRLFRTVTLTCDGAPSRTMSSVAFMQEGPRWVDVLAVKSGDDLNVRVRRYRVSTSQQLADGSTAPQGRDMDLEAGSERWTVDDVVEASAALPADAVQAAISHGQPAFALNAQSLTRLSDASVDERVIDVMVALTYPSKFVVTHGNSGGSMVTLPGEWSDPFFSPILGAASMYGCFDPYGWASANYWAYCSQASPFFSRWGPGFYSGFYGAYGYNGWVNTVNPNPQPGGGNEPVATGRVVNGRGYTQVSPVQATVVNGGSGSNGINSQSSGSGGSSGVSSGGYSGGGGMSGGDSGGGRTAVPRGGGQ